MEASQAENHDQERIETPLFWSSFSLADKLRSRRAASGLAPVLLRRGKEQSPALRLLSWTRFLAAPAALFAAAFLVPEHSLAARALTAIGCALIFWIIFGKTPATTVGQVLLGMIACVGGLGFGIVCLWGSPLVVLLAPAFLFSLLVLVVVIRTLLGRNCFSPTV